MILLGSICLISKLSMLNRDSMRTVLKENLLKRSIISWTTIVKIDEGVIVNSMRIRRFGI